MPESKAKRNKKGTQKKEEIAQILEQCGSDGIVDAIDIRATQKKQKPKYYRRHSA